MLKKTHWEQRLKVTISYQTWTVENFKRVLWSYETKINWIGSDGKAYVWRERGEQLSDWTTISTVKHGGENNLMVGVVWCEMGWKSYQRLKEKWMLNNIVRFWRIGWWKAYYQGADIFLTATENPKWPEIQEALLPGQSASDHPDTICHVFHLKMAQLIKDICEHGIMGRTVAQVWTNEFQKRGLPHMHMVIFLHPVVFCRVSR